MGEETNPPIVCDVCGKEVPPYKRAHDCDGGVALRKAAHELFTPTVPLIERVLAQAGTGILRAVFEVVYERDRLKSQNDSLLRELQEARERIAALEASARRYLWLRPNLFAQQGNVQFKQHSVMLPFGVSHDHLSGNALDEAIDSGVACDMPNVMASHNSAALAKGEKGEG